MGVQKSQTQLLLPGLGLLMVAVIIMIIGGFGRNTKPSSGKGPSHSTTWPIVATSVAGAIERTAPPSKVDATTSASFKLEPYIPYHDTLKRYAYSVFAGQHQVLSTVIRQVEKAVVAIDVEETVGDMTRLTTIGSGLIIDPRGYVLTISDNIVNQANFKIILFDGNHRHQFDGVVEAVDPAAKLALIRIPYTGTFVLPFYSIWDYTPVGLGDWVIACGSPDGLHILPMQGIVSSTNRSRKIESRYFYGLIKTDLKIEGTMVGSPVFDLQGKLVGLYIGDGLVQPVNETISPIFSSNGIR